MQDPIVAAINRSVFCRREEKLGNKPEALETNQGAGKPHYREASQSGMIDYYSTQSNRRDAFRINMNYYSRNADLGTDRISDL